MGARLLAGILVLFGAMLAVPGPSSTAGPEPRATAKRAPPLGQESPGALRQPSLRLAPGESGPADQATSSVGVSARDGAMLALAKSAASECSQALENAINQGIKSENEIFSTLYFPITPLTIPRTYSTFYDDYTDAAITPIEDRYLEMNKSAIFVVLVDRNGYLPSHNSKFSRPRTGDPEQDLKTSRSKRLFNDVTGFRAAKNQGEFLLQIYRRDTGELIKDLSVPVMVNGKHWGALRIGYALD